LPENLAARLAQLARELQDEDHAATTADHIAHELADWVGNSSSAGITTVHRRRRVETTAATSEGVRRGDALQYELREWPCLDAIWEAPQIFTGDLRSDTRWPRWAAKVGEEFEVRSMLCTRLFTKADTLAR